MPVSKVNKRDKCDTIVKHLRRREVSCKVTPVPLKDAITDEPNLKKVGRPSGSRKKSVDKTAKTDKQTSEQMQTKNAERKDTFDDASNSQSDLTPRKRTYRKKNNVSVASPVSSSPAADTRRRPSTKLTRYQDFCCDSSDSLSPSPERVFKRENSSSSDFEEEFKPKKKCRGRRSKPSLDRSFDMPITKSRRLSETIKVNKRKSFYDTNSLHWNKLLSSTFPLLEDTNVISSEVLVEIPKTEKCLTNKEDTNKSPKMTSSPKISVFNVDELNTPSGTLVVEVAKKRAYRKKSTSTNTVSEPPQTLTSSNFLPEDPLTCNSTDSESTLSQMTSVSDLVYQPKRGRGRPRKSVAPVLMLMPNEEELPRSADRRRRKSGWHWDCEQETKEEEEEEEEEEPLSEYELLRRRNIEENFKMLRQIFSDQGLQFEDKNSENAPKARKSPSKLPLPPPRPKSARIEMKRTSLDFSKFTQRISIA